MMRRVLGCVLATGLGLLAAPDKAAAQAMIPNQGTNPGLRPAFSPFLNLTRPGNAATNYYGIVRPQIGFAKDIQNLQMQQQFSQPQWAVTPEEEEAAGSYSITGHQA